MNKVTQDDLHTLEAKELTSPFLDIFSGSDGGAAFVKLQFVVLPKLLRDADNGDAASVRILNTLYSVSNLFKGILEGKV